MATTTHTAPINIEQINSVFYVTGRAEGFATIQQAVDFVSVYNNNSGLILVGQGVDVADDIRAVTGGGVSILIWDYRAGNDQHWIWNGSNYVPDPLRQAAGFIAYGEPTDQVGASMMGFDPNGTGGIGTGNFRVAANPGQPMPSWQVLLEPQDGSGAAWTIIRASAPPNGTGFPTVNFPSAIVASSAITRFGDHYQLWTGELPGVSQFGVPGRGMYVWQRPADNAIDLQGMTDGTSGDGTAGTYDQTIRLNPLGGDVTIAKLGTTSVGQLLTAGMGITGDIHQTGNIYLAGNASMGRLTCVEIAGSTVTGDPGPVTILTDLTVAGFANIGDLTVAGTATLSQDPLQPLEAATRHYVDQAIIEAGGFVFPPAGITVSTGSAWGTPINPATLATYPGAGVPVSTGSAWGTPINPATLATYPGAGVPVSTGSAWGTSISPANIALTNAANTFTQPQAITGAMTVSGTMQAGTNGNTAWGVRIGQRAGAAPPWNSGSPNINADNVNMILNASSTGGVYLNWDQGTGTNFGNGAGVVVATVNTSGDFFANGHATIYAGLAIKGAGPALGANSFNLTSQSNTELIDALGPNTTTKGRMQLRLLTSDQSSYIVPLDLQDGAVAVQGTLTATNAFIANGTCFLNWNGGANIYFGNGAGGQVGNLDTSGNLNVNGTITGGSKSFLITHPLDPTKNLKHGCIEGPEFAVYYRGEAETVDGKATITLPDYFEALTLPDQRTVQLTTITEGEPPTFAQLAAGRVKDGQFTVYSSNPSAKFYWEVKAVRADIAPLEVVTDKPTEEAD